MILNVSGRTDIVAFYTKWFMNRYKEGYVMVRNPFNYHLVNEIYLNSKEEVNILDTLDKRERWIANYILNNGKIKAKDIASHFKISLNTANNWIKEWLENGFLVRENDKQIRNVDYILTKKYQEKIK